jgi:ABC-2 type transport system permease protein
MLWYKSLREIRTIALIGTAAMALSCVLFVLNEHAIRTHAHGTMSYTEYVWKTVYDGGCQQVFIALSVILGSGSLLQEKAHGTAGFTLAFPVSRRRIVFTRAAMGYLGILSIAAVPVAIVPVASRHIGEAYPIEQCLGFFCLWAGCSSVFYGLTFLFAHRIEGDYVSFLLAVPSLILYDAIMDLPWVSKLRMLNIFDILSGEDMPFFDSARHLLTGHLPWSALTIMLIISFALIAVSARRMMALDF